MTKAIRKVAAGKCQNNGRDMDYIKVAEAARLGDSAARKALKDGGYED